MDGIFPGGAPFKEWKGGNDTDPDFFNEKLLSLLHEEMILAIGGHAMYPVEYRTSMRCHDTMVMVEATRLAYNENFGVNEIGGALLVKSKMALALACAYSCARANLKDRVSDPQPRFDPESATCIDTRDIFEATQLFWKHWRPVIETMDGKDPFNRDITDILDKIAEDGDEDEDMASVYEWIKDEGEYDWKYPNALIDDDSISS